MIGQSDPYKRKMVDIDEEDEKKNFSPFSAPKLPI
jgi:hypothetical protein